MCDLQINFFSLTLMSSLAFVNFIVTPRWLEASETNRAFVGKFLSPSSLPFFAPSLFSPLSLTSHFPAFLTIVQLTKVISDEQEYILEDHVKQSMLNFNLKSALSIPKQQVN